MEKTLRSEMHLALCEALRVARQGAGIRQQELADRLGVPQSFVSKMETGERNLDVIQFVHVCEALGIDAGQLITTIRQATE